MKAVIQRVLRGSVAVDGYVVGSIGQGLHILVGISRDDVTTDMDYIIKKILSLKLFSDPNGDGARWEKSVREAELELLVVSQFTLYGNINKGTKPDFSKAMRAEQSESMYNEFVAKLKKEYPKVQTGQFGAHMNIDLQLDGPVTILLESPVKNVAPTQA